MAVFKACAWINATQWLCTASSTLIWKLDLGVRAAARLGYILPGSTPVNVDLVHVTLTSRAKNFSSPKTPWRLRMKALWSFEMSEISYRATQTKNPEGLNSQNQRCGHSNIPTPVPIGQGLAWATELWRRGEKPPTMSAIKALFPGRAAFSYYIISS